MRISNERIEIESNDYGEQCVVIIRWKTKKGTWKEEDQIYHSCSTIEGLYNGIRNFPINLTKKEKEELKSKIKFGI